jgi:hypothetical protein
VADIGNLQRGPLKKEDDVYRASGLAKGAKGQGARRQARVACRSAPLGQLGAASGPSPTRRCLKCLGCRESRPLGARLCLGEDAVADVVFCREVRIEGSIYPVGIDLSRCVRGRGYLPYSPPMCSSAGCIHRCIRRLRSVYL